MNCIMDASFAVQLAINPKNISQKSLLSRVQDSTVILAPSLFMVEVSNAFWKYYHFGDFSRAESRIGLHRARGPINLVKALRCARSPPC